MMKVTRDSTATEDNTRNGVKPWFGSRAMLVWAAFAMAGALGLQHAPFLDDPFFSDDYRFLDRARTTALPALFGYDDLAYGYWRPWSRGLHFWTLERTFGATPLPFHLASLALATAALTLFFAYARRWIGSARALAAVYGVVALAAWDLPIRWPSAAQDLWAIALGLASLVAFTRGRTALACVALVPALLSKETAAVIPAIALAHGLVIERRSFRAALVRVAPLGAVVAAWALVHPALGGRWLHAATAAPLRAYQDPVRAIVRSVLATVNLDALPQGTAETFDAFKLGLFPALFVIWMAWRLTSVRTAEAAPVTATATAPRRVALLGACWAALAWLPLALPSLIWQPYYVLLGALGCWLALAALLPRGVLIALIAAVALLRAPRLETHVDEWGDAKLHARGRQFMARTERFLRATHPDPPPATRMFFGAVPRGMVFVLGPGDAPALDVWYQRPVPGSFWQDYHVRTANQPSGPDYFFTHDSTTGWREVAQGDEPADTTRHASPTWGPDHERLAITLTEAGAPRAASVEYAKLASVFPARADYAYLAGLTAETAGDAALATRWYREAAQRPGADERMRARAERAR